MATDTATERPATQPPAADVPLRIRSVTAADMLTLVGAAAGALALDWVLYERVLPFSGALGFWVCWYVLFLVFYTSIAFMQWDRLAVQDKVVQVALSTFGVLATAIVIDQVAYTLVRGLAAVRHSTFWTQTMARAGPLSPISVGGIAHALVGTLEMLALSTFMSVPLGIAAAVYLAEVGGRTARPVRTLVDAMTSLPDIISGLFILAFVVLTIGLPKSGFAASLALAVTMLPIVTRASETVLRIVPGTLREGSYALGASHWRTVMKVVLPTARSGLATAVVLAMARGIGETAPVLVVSGVTKEMNLSPLHGPQMSLPLIIWDYAHVEAVNQAIVTRAFGAGLTLVVVVVVLFAVARALGGNAPGELTRRQQRRLARQAARA